MYCSCTASARTAGIPGRVPVERHRRRNSHHGGTDRCGAVGVWGLAVGEAWWARRPRGQRPECRCCRHPSLASPATCPRALSPTLPHSNRRDARPGAGGGAVPPLPAARRGGAARAELGHAGGAGGAGPGCLHVRGRDAGLQVWCGQGLLPKRGVVASTVQVLRPPAGRRSRSQGCGRCACGPTLCCCRPAASAGAAFACLAAAARPAPSWRAACTPRCAAATRSRCPWPMRRAGCGAASRLRSTTSWQTTGGWRKLCCSWRRSSLGPAAPPPADPYRFGCLLSFHTRCIPVLYCNERSLRCVANNKPKSLANTHENPPSPAGGGLA